MTSPTPIQRRVRKRSLPWLLTLVSWAALVLFAIGSIGSSLTGSSVFLSTQTIERYAPWSALDEAPPSPLPNQWLGDTIDSVTPRMLLNIDMLSSGEFAQWNPYVVGGAPGFSIPDGGTFSPLSLPWYITPAALAPGMVKFLEIVVVTLGMSLLMRRFRLPSASWALSSLIYSSSAFMVAWTNWQQTRVAALIPLLFWAVDVAAVRRRWRDCAPVAIVTASMLAGGFPAVTGFAMYAAAAYALARTLSTTRAFRDLARAALVGITGILAGAGLWAWQLLPFVDHATHTIDFSLRQQSSGRHLTLDPLVTAFIPEIYGGPVNAYWGLKNNPIETFSYLGASTVVLILVITAFGQHRSGVARFLLRFSIGAIGVTLLLVYVGGIPLALVQMLPVFSNNSIGRAVVILGFFSAVAAGVTFGTLIRPGPVVTPTTLAPSNHGLRSLPSRRPALLHVLRLTLATGLALGLVMLTVHALTEVPPEHWQEIRTATVRGVIFIGIALAVTITGFALPNRWTRGVAAVAIPVITLVPALLVTAVWWPKGSTDYFYPPTPMHDFLAANLGHDRFVSVDWTALPGTSSAYRLRAANGHGWHTTEWKDMLRAADTDVMSTATYSTLKTIQSLSSPALDRLAVRYGVLSPSTLLPGQIEVLRTSDEVVHLAPGETATAAATTPFRGIVLTLPEGWSVGDGGARILVQAFTRSGELLATTDYAVEHDWPAAQMWIPLAAEEAPGTAVDLKITVTSQEAGPLAIAGDSTSSIAVEVMRPIDDGLRVVHTTGAVVLERLDAMDRFRWAGREQVVEDEERAVDLLGTGRLPDDTVVIAHSSDAIVPTGSTAQLAVISDTTDVLELDVVADGLGWLVIADSLQGGGGWRAYVDGAPVNIVRADHALGAIAVPQGTHRVTVKYDAPGMRLGLLISAVTALALAASYLPIGGAGRVTHRKRRLAVQVSDR